MQWYKERRIWIVCQDYFNRLTTHRDTLWGGRCRCLRVYATTTCNSRLRNAYVFPITDRRDINRKHLQNSVYIDIASNGLRCSEKEKGGKKERETCVTRWVRLAINSRDYNEMQRNVRDGTNNDIYQSRNSVSPDHNNFESLRKSSLNISNFFFVIPSIQSTLISIKYKFKVEQRHLSITKFGVFMDPSDHNNFESFRKSSFNIFIFFSSFFQCSKH